MKSALRFISITLISIFISFQNPNPLTKPQTLSRDFGVLLDSLHNFKHANFKEANDRANFLLASAEQIGDWETYFKTWNFKIAWCQFSQQFDSIKPFLIAYEKKLAQVSPFSKNSNGAVLPTHKAFVGEAQLRWGEYYGLLNQIENVIRINKELLAGYKNGLYEFEDNIKGLRGVNYTLGYWTCEIGQITEGVDYLLTSNDWNDKLPVPPLDFSIMINSQIVKQYTRLGQFQKAFKYLLIADKKAEKLAQTGIGERTKGFLISNYHAVAKYYLEIEKPDSALLYLKKAMPLLKPIHQSESFLLQGKCFILLKKWTEAEKLLTAALTTIGDKFEAFGSQKPQILLQLTQIKQKQQQTQAALSYCQKALAALDPKLDTADFAQQPTVFNVLMKKELLQALELKSTLLLDASPQFPNYLPICYHTAQLAVNLIDTIRSDYTADYDKQYLAQVSYPIYETALNAAYQLAHDQPNKKAFYQDAILGIIEKSRAVVLLDALRKGQAETDFSEADRLKTYQFRTDLAALDKKIFDLNLKNSDTTLKNTEIRRATLRQQFETYLLDLKNRYPQYAAVKFSPPSLNIANVRTMLSDTATFVTYFVGEKSIFSLAINKQEAAVFKSEQVARLPVLVETIRKSVRPRSRDDERSDIQNYCQAAFELYDWLFKAPLSIGVPSDSISMKKPSRLIVSPDGALHFLPLDILLTEKVAPTPNMSYENLPYLLWQSDISYVTSAALWQQQRGISNHRANNLFIGFAPQYLQTAALTAVDTTRYKDAISKVEKSGTLEDMPAARREVEHISALLKSPNPFLGATATEDNFTHFAPDYRILHLSMHAEPNSDDPAFSQLIFSQKDTFSLTNRLYINELQSMKLNADLVVLSACETGFGVLNRGEGVMSLARAFSSVGVPTTVMSLWKIPSGATEKVATHFYTILKQGAPTSKALQAAKQRYLKEESALSPYYWAGLVAIGDGDRMPIVAAWGWGQYGLLAFIGVLVGAFAFLFKKRLQS